MRKIILITITAILILVGYIAYQLIEQNRSDQNLSYNCEENPNYDTTLVFSISKENKDSAISIFLNNKKIKFDAIITDKEGNFEYTYSEAFSKDDKIEIISKNKRFIIDKFQYESIIINEKKEPECKFKGAFINKKFIDGKLFELK